MQETDLSVKAEINLYYDIHVPENHAGPAPLLIAVHGYGAHKRYMMREAKAVTPENFVIVSLQGPHHHFRKTDDGYRIGFGWLSDYKSEESVHLHHNFLLRVIDQLDSRNLIDPANIYLYGFSQACALNFRFAFTHPDILKGFIGVCGGIPGDLDTNPVYKPFSADTFYLYGDDDEFYTQEKFKDFNDKLASLLPNYESKHYAAKHEITEDMRVDIRKFLTK
jgi:predicted esterase